MAQNFGIPGILGGKRPLTFKAFVYKRRMRPAFRDLRFILQMWFRMWRWKEGGA